MDLHLWKRGTSRRRHATLREKIMTALSVLAILPLWICAASAYIHPSALTGIGVLGLGFPFLLGGAVLMLVLTLLLAPRRSWVPAVGLLLCARAIYTYCPINLPTTPQEGSIKVMSYNVYGWGKHTEAYDTETSENFIVRYLAGSDADIICAQETRCANSFPRKYMARYAPWPLHKDSIQIDDSRISVFSKYPILRQQLICHDGNNGVGAFWLLLAPGDTVVVVNCHLKTMGITADERAEFSSMVHAPDENLSEEASLALLRKIAGASIRRAAMADTVAQFVEEQRGRSLILCGDFNDSPISYTHHRISRHLTDAYRATGNGPGRSFNRDAIFVRIDNILCSDDWKPAACTIDNTVPYSDHYPIICYLKRKK